MICANVRRFRLHIACFWKTALLFSKTISFIPWNSGRHPFIPTTFKKPDEKILPAAGKLAQRLRRRNYWWSRRSISWGVGMILRIDNHCMQWSRQYFFDEKKSDQNDGHRYENFFELILWFLFEVDCDYCHKKYTKKNCILSRQKRIYCWTKSEIPLVLKRNAIQNRQNFVFWSFSNSHTLWQITQSRWMVRRSERETLCGIYNALPHVHVKRLEFANGISFLLCIF